MDIRVDVLPKLGQISIRHHNGNQTRIQRFQQVFVKQAIDTANSDYRAPFNVLANSFGVATPEDKFVVTPNSGTPYSYLWMDLRAEPIVVSMPEIEKNRYYTGSSSTFTPSTSLTWALVVSATTEASS